jgi:N-acetylmuramoyl-L-alanine amidase
MEMDELPLKGRRVCLDPGHPSENGVGTRGKRLTEVGVAWRVAVRLKTLLQATGADVVMTKRREMEKVTNRRRAQIANAARADLMLRLHCDAAATSGISTYYPDTAGTAPDRTHGPSRAVIDGSRRAARPFHDALIRSLGGALNDRGLLTDRQTGIGAKQGGALTGSIYSGVPVLLVEMCVLTNPRDEAFMAAHDGEARMARALFEGVRAALIGVT